MHKINLIPLRAQWFKLKALEFIKRYSSGLLVIAIILPGVAVGENLNLILFALTQPLLILSDPSQQPLTLFLWNIAVILIFSVWARAQKTAINGGDFAQQMKSLPIDKLENSKANFLMIVIANHFLWVLMIYGFYHLINTTPLSLIQLLRYSLLLLLLLTIQYVTVFSEGIHKKKNTLLLMLFSLGLIFPITIQFEWLKLLSLYGLLILFSYNFLTHNPLSTSSILLPTKSLGGLKTSSIYRNLYFQMLFKSDLASSIFRIVLIIALAIGFIFTSNHFSEINDNNLIPFLVIIEAMTAYYLTGFYIVFHEKRSGMHEFLATIPIPEYYWFIRDVIAVMFISIPLHSFFLIWLAQHFTTHVIIMNCIYHLLLLIIAYPLRTRFKEKTFTPFVAILIITILTIYHSS